MIPITIVTGYLGSGKTTLLKNILQAKHGKKIAVIQNEFGVALGIEEAMIVSERGDKNFEWLELNNGCICCTIKHDFLVTLENLVKRKNNHLDYIIIETDGRVDPSSIIEIFWTDEELKSPVYLDAVITVVDASLILKQLSRSNPQFVNEAERQIAFADKIILNKQELITPPELHQITQTLLTINGLSSIEVTSYSQVNIDTLLNIKFFDKDKFLKIVESLTPNHQHDNEVTTLTLRVDNREVDIDKFNLFMDKLIWDKKIQPLRSFE